MITAKRSLKRDPEPSTKVELSLDFSPFSMSTKRALASNPEMPASMVYSATNGKKGSGHGSMNEGNSDAVDQLPIVDDRIGYDENAFTMRACLRSTEHGKPVRIGCSIRETSSCLAKQLVFHLLMTHEGN